MSLAGMVPHQVEILYDFEGGANVTVCAGTIISSYLVLAVATCLAGRHESLFKIRANGKNQNESQIRAIDQVYSYAAIDSEASPFDIAVIRLNSELELDKNHTSKISYDQSHAPAHEQFSRTTSACLERGVSQVSVIASSECSELLKGKEEKNFICVEPSENIAPSLSGSSLICSGVLHGVLAVNSSNDGGNSGKRVYTSVAAYSHWIRFLFVENDKTGPDHNLAATSFGGTEVNQITNPVPYQLSLRFNGKHICGGIILDKRTALSAAHCFDPHLLNVPSLNLNHFALVAGEQNLHENDSTEQILLIEKLTKHPKYNDVIRGNDIAVIFVKGEFNFNARVNNIWVSSQTAQTSNNQVPNLTATGWGKTTTHGDASPVLLSVDLELLEHSRCKRKWPFLKDSMICGYNNVSNICEGDSGGPLVIKNYRHGPHTVKDLLVGISSFSHRTCEEQNMPNGFTNVSSFYDWIAEARSNLSNSNPNQNQNRENPNEAGGPEFSLLLERLETLEKKHQKLKKSHVELKRRFKSLEKEVEELKRENSVGDDVWLLRPPLRGRRGLKGEKGDCGLVPPKTGENPGEKGECQIQLPSPSPDSKTPAPQSQQNSLTSCSDAMEIVPPPRSKNQTIYPHGNETSLKVLCDFETDGGGWTIIQKRSSGPWNDFFQSWYSYEKGFGTLEKNFWLGLENIRALTQNGDQELRIELKDFEGEKRWAKYSNFSVSNASDFYRLSIGGFSGDVGNDLMRPHPSHGHNGMQFSTADQDNDKHWDNCAGNYYSGWWFNACSAANLNGAFYEKGERISPRGQGITWLSWKGNEYSLKKTEMKIRKRK